MREPQISSFFSILKDPKFTVRILNNEDALREMLYYLDPERSQNVLSALMGRTNEDRKQIITNLAKLYPLSRFLIKVIVDNFKDSDDFVCDGFELERGVINSLTRALNTMKKKVHNNTFFNSCKEKLSKLNDQVKDLQPQIDEAMELARREQELKEQLETDKKSREIAALKESIKSLEDQINSLENDLKNNQQKREENEMRVARLCKDLENQHESWSLEQQELWHQLLSKFPADGEESK